VRLLIATTNRDKLREIHTVLRGTPVELLTLADLPPVEEPDETGTTFAENARPRRFITRRPPLVPSTIPRC